MRNCRTFLKKYCPIPSVVAFAVGILSFVLLIASKQSADVAEWICVYISAPLRFLMAKALGWLPVSLAEILIALAVFVAALIIIIALRLRGAAARIRYLVILLSIASLLFSCYFFTLGVGYHRKDVGTRMNIEAVKVTEDNLLSTLDILKEECDKLLPKISYDGNGASVCPHTVSELSEKISDAYISLAEDYPEMGLETFDSNAKPVMASELMTKLGILGVYTFFTGESNVNVHYPDYTLPFTVAHEFAHQRGISRENEANFIAFAVCIRSDDAYIQYSGYLNMIEYLMSALSKTNRDLYGNFMNELDGLVIGELRAYSEFYHENKSELLGKISNFFNDNYLKLQGTEGIISYGLVVRLTVAYYSN